MGSVPFNVEAEPSFFIEPASGNSEVVAPEELDLDVVCERPDEDVEYSGESAASLLVSGVAGGIYDRAESCLGGNFGVRSPVSNIDGLRAVKSLLS